MNIKIPTCKWALCTAPASKHLVFGFSTKRLDPGVVIHRDVCEHHIATIRQSFRCVDEYPLGECPIPLSESDVKAASPSARAHLLPCE